AVRVSSEFEKKYSAEYSMVLRLSAKQRIAAPLIVGPAIVRRSSYVEYSVFLPKSEGVFNREACCGVLKLFLVTSVGVLKREGIVASISDNVMLSVGKEQCFVEGWRGR